MYCVVWWCILSEVWVEGAKGGVAPEGAGGEWEWEWEWEWEREGEWDIGGP